MLLKFPAIPIFPLLLSDQKAGKRGKLRKLRQEKTAVRAIAVKDIHPMKKILMGQFLIISGAWALSGLFQLGSIV